MPVFCWTGEQTDPPPRWDLRRAGWRLSPGWPDRSEVCIVDLRERRADIIPDKLAGAAEAARYLFLGVDHGDERARLLEAGCEALPSDVELPELDQRARRLAAARECLPRRRKVGPVVLDLVYRDARAGQHWLALHPREFELLWRLAEHPRESVSRARLLREVWRLDFEPGTNTVEVHVSRLRAKLAGAGIERLVETDPEGGYRLALPREIPAEQLLCA